MTAPAIAVGDEVAVYLGWLSSPRVSAFVVEVGLDLIDVRVPDASNIVVYGCRLVAGELLEERRRGGWVPADYFEKWEVPADPRPPIPIDVSEQEWDEYLQALGVV